MSRRKRGAKFEVSGKFNGKQTATVTIDRESGLFTVRPRRFRKTYTMRLSDVAETVMWRVLKAEAGES